MRLAVGILLILLVQPLHAAGNHYAGRPVAEVLEELRGSGLALIYNTQLVPPTLRVAQEPRAADPEQLLAEILREHGLALSRLAERAYAVVRAPAEGPGGRQADAPADAGLQAEEVIVTSSRYGLAAAQLQPNTVFTREQIEDMPRLGDETLRAVHRLPGAASNGVSGLARIRGGEENETAIVLNGLTLFEPFHLKNFFGPISLIDSRLLAGIDVHTGGYTAGYGERMSAVIDARTLDPPLSPVAGREGKNYYELGVSAFHTNGLASGPFDGGRGGWLATVRRSNLDEVAQFNESDYGEPNYFDGFARVTYALSPRTRLAVNVLGSHDQVRAQTTGDIERSRAGYRNRYLWAEWEHDGENGLYTRLIPSVTAVDNDRSGNVDDPAGVVGQVYDHREFQVVGLRYEGRYEPRVATGRLRHQWGAEVRALEAGYSYASSVQFADRFLLPVLSLPAGTRALDRRFELEPGGEQYAAWWSVRARLSTQLVAEAGIRWDAQTYTGAGLDEQLSPRLNLLLEPSDALRLRASWGRFYQPEGIHELQVEDGVRQFFPAQRADHLIFSLERDLPQQVQLRVELYRKDYSRLRARYENMVDPLVLLPELQFDRIRIEPDAAHMQAVEVLLSRRSDASQDRRWNGWISYTLARAEDRFGGRETVRSWDQRHAVQAGVDRTGRYWDFALALTWHSGWPITALTIDAAGAGGTPEVEPGPRNGERLKDFGSVDLRLSRRFPLPRGELSAYGEVTNAFDRRNPCCREYTAQVGTDGRLQLESRTRSWLPFVPSVGLLWKF